MATYFHGGSQEMTHPDGLQALLLMNHGYATCPTADPALCQNPTFNSPNLYCQPPPPPPPPPSQQQQQNYAVYWPESAEEENGVHTLQRILSGSKFLKATRELLEEVVDVGKELKDGSPKTPKMSVEVDGGKPTADLVAGEKQELEMKKAKLTCLLNEVEQRYRQYEDQMRGAMSSFESIAGVGSARAYTALALRTISRQFRCLKDAIGGQIRAAGKSLGEDEYPWGSLFELRQQKRALEHNNAWRPARGLPERSVSVLRAWLFDHFLHPYPKDSDKLLLAKKTGLTRNQVSNWFINARVRLWKPMVEEMYMEEMKGQEPRKNDGGNVAGTSNNVDRNEDVPPPASSSTVTQPMVGKVHGNNNNGAEEEIAMQPEMKKARVCHLSPLDSTEMEVKMGDRHGYNLDLLTSGLYPIGETGGFQGNGVSLTLGLPRTGVSPAPYLDGDGYVIGRRFGTVAEANVHQHCNLNDGGSNPTATSDYDRIGIQNRKGFAAQLLPDFLT